MNMVKSKIYGILWRMTLQVAGFSSGIPPALGRILATLKVHFYDFSSGGDNLEVGSRWECFSVREIFKKLTSKLPP